VVQTLALPFLLISVSNASILLAIYKNKKNFNPEHGSNRSQKKKSTGQKAKEREKPKQSGSLMFNFNFSISYALISKRRQG
jgi:hypothetical protein